jgi:hypothetical protein
MLPPGSIIGITRRVDEDGGSSAFVNPSRDTRLGWSGALLRRGALGDLVVGTAWWAIIAARCARRFSGGHGVVVAKSGAGCRLPAPSVWQPDLMVVCPFPPPATPPHVVGCLVFHGARGIPVGLQRRICSMAVRWIVVSQFWTSPSLSMVVGLRRRWWLL